MASQDDRTNAQNCGNTVAEKRVIGRPFQPGEAWTGNAGGRPKRKWLTEVADELLKEKLSDPKAREEYKKHLWDKLTKSNVVGAMTLDRVWERTEGKMPTNVKVGGELTVTISERLKKARDRKSRK